jgi:hypothetical protein
MHYWLHERLFNVDAAFADEDALISRDNALFMWLGVRYQARDGLLRKCWGTSVPGTGNEVKQVP